jgi:hypothetical protein
MGKYFSVCCAPVKMSLLGLVSVDFACSTFLLLTEHPEQEKHIRFICKASIAKRKFFMLRFVFLS